MITAIIFDLDDLMVHSSPLHNKAYELALKDFGIIKPIIPPELMRNIYGMRIKEIIELLARHFKMKVDVAELTRRRNEYFMELVKKKGVRPMPGLFELIENIKKWGFKCAVASSGVRDYVNIVITKLGLDGFFGAVVTGDDVQNPKPAPDTFLLAAKKLGVKPALCAVIEDATKGIEAAKVAGMLAIGVKNSVIDSGQDMSKADIVVNRLDEITLEMLGHKR